MASEQDKVEIQIDVTGGQESARNVDQVSSSLEQLVDWGGQAAPKIENVQTNFGRLSQSGVQVAQRLQGAAGAAQTLVSAFGSHDRSAGMIASTAGATAQFAAMGSILGPAGTVIGGVIGLTAGLADLRAEADRVNISTVRTAGGLTALGHSIRAAREQMFSDAAIDAGDAFGSTVEEITDRLEGMEQRLREVRNLRVEALFARENEEARLYREEAERLSAAIQNLSSARDRLRGPGTDLGNGFRFFADAPPSLPSGVDAPTDPNFMRRGRGGGGTSAAEEANERYLRSAEEVAERLRALEEQKREEERKTHEHAMELLEERQRRIEEAAEREFATQREVNEALADAQRQLEERRAEGLRAQKDAEYELEVRALEQRRQNWSDAIGFMEGTATAMGDTLGDLATGQKTTEQAFIGLAAAFLEMISEYASMKAATEFADAAASFARYDYGGGAAHIGAGLAFTAVAVATGVGAAVVGSAPSAPARPERERAANDGTYSNVTVVNFNSPVVTAATEAELGRSIEGLRAAAGSI